MTLPVDLLKELEDSGLKIMTAMINKNYMNGDCSDHRKISLISLSGKSFARMLSERLESKIKEVIEEDQFGFRKKRALEMLEINEKYI